jgi:hypothetical protein
LKNLLDSELSQEDIVPRNCDDIPEPMKAEELVTNPFKVRSDETQQIVPNQHKQERLLKLKVPTGILKGSESQRSARDQSNSVF